MESGATDEDLWRPPAWLYNPDPGENAAAEWYYERLRFIVKEWKIGQMCQILPPELRSRTPFSLALLSQLGQLAALTKNDLPQAHELLITQFKKRRVSGADPAGVQPVTTLPSEVHGMGYRRRVEKQITENLDGLMLTDVNRVIGRLRDTAADLLKASARRPAGKGKSCRKARATKALSQAVENTRAAQGETQEKRAVRKMEDMLKGLSAKTELSKLKMQRRRDKMQARLADRPMPALPSERLEVGSLPTRSAEEVDNDRFVSGMTSLSHASNPKAFEMRATEVEDVDEDDEDESDDEMA